MKDNIDKSLVSEHIGETVNIGGMEFKPCPICGRQLTSKDIEFIDEEGYQIGDLDSVVDFENLCNPVNIIDYETMDESDRQRMKEEHVYSVDNIDHVLLLCSCGYSYTSKPYYFYDKKWYEEFKEEANRRA